MDCQVFFESRMLPTARNRFAVQNRPQQALPEWNQICTGEEMRQGRECDYVDCLGGVCCPFQHTHTHPKKWTWKEKTVNKRPNSTSNDDAIDKVRGENSERLQWSWYWKFLGKISLFGDFLNAALIVWFWIYRSEYLVNISVTKCYGERYQSEIASLDREKKCCWTAVA